MFTSYIPDKLSFTFYKDEEIEKMSVMEVLQPQSLDNFNHPVPDGLCDPRMGPHSPDGVCKTCNLTYLNCPGHFGHIKLEKPVFNPILFSTLYSLLRSTCFKCKFLKITNYDRVILYLKFNLLKKGCSIDNLEFLYSIPTESELYTRIIEILMSSEGINVTSTYKHQELASLVFKSASLKTRCLKCRYKNQKIIHSKNLKILIDNTDGAVNKKLSFFTPEEIAEIFKVLFKNESDLMEAIFSTNDYQMFFMYNIAVPPVKFRPVNFYKGKSYENPQNLNFIHIIKMNCEVKKDIEFWPELQAAILYYFDSSKSTYIKAEVSAGHKQILEKKDGLFRRNIMGKRVNFSARSVISPDPNLGTREMGIPKIFAEKLTFPEKVNSANYDNLRKAVINGNKYPGATAIQFGKNLQNLEYISYEKRVALANQLLSGNKSVWRHLHDGDVVLVNRQPTLHKSSIMAHKVRVLEGEKTLRMHYANCKSYNADFDGDEMNIHFPQSQVARAEAEFISLNDNMYLIPTNGEPVRGLAQDHVVAASVLTLKDSFFTKENYIDLLNAGLPCRKLVLEKPCIKKPVELYSGKQVISSILKNLNIHINLTKKTKIVEQSWGDHVEEAVCIFQDGEMLTGILDKNTIGPTHSSLIHACGEMYGFGMTNDILTYISRTVNRYLFIFGFTLRIDDLFLDKSSDLIRDKLIIEGSRAASFKQKDFIEKDKTYYLNQNKINLLDSIIREEMNNLTTKIVDACVPSGLMKKFPDNNMGFIIITGAKGSMVNLSQISASLGQQDLEGKRVSIMVSGKTLPCYKPFESCPSAGGYVFQRFLTGVNPPEFFFHCMAGREGLIDTAVKTSRSGYLQRCLVKHLEGIKVEYDLSVRMEGSLIQYLYGEDGLDCTRSMFLNEFEFYKNNAHNLKNMFKSLKMSEEKILSKIYNSSFKENLSSFEPEYRDIFYKNYIKALIDPGEAVGILAGQSVGEPSTQMTLNTFHLAGVGAKNVTLGIPRLREIIMVASKKIKTPLITVPLKKSPSIEFIDAFKRITLKECIENIFLEENIILKQGIYQKEIKITITISQHEKFAVPFLDTKFLSELGKNIKKLSKISGSINILEITTASKNEKVEDEDSDKDKESSHENEEALDFKKDESNEEDDIKKDEEDDLTAINIDLEENKTNVEDVSEDEESLEIKLHNFKKIGHKRYSFVAYYPSDFNIMMLPVIESLLSKIIVKEHRGVNRATISNNNVLIEGSDFYSMIDLVTVENEEMDPLDYFSVYESTSNDIYGIYTTFGVEAARESIINEIINVFDVYGIEIDIRHLKLIADYMTRNGEFSAFNRNGLNYSSSPLQKMSFESCFTNIKKASEYHLTDNLENPSASLTLGVPINVGTTVFDLFYDMNSHMV